MYIIPQLRADEKVVYLRKSRKDDPLLSVEEVVAKHKQEIDEWLEQNQAEGGPVPEGNIFKEVVSGETIEDRPKMKEILRLVESPKIKAIVCKEPSRLSRGDLMDIGYLVKILRYTGTYVFTLRGCYDLRDDRDREQFERELMRGNDYLEYQKKIMKDGKLLAVKNGCYIGSTAPYGYTKTTIKVAGRHFHTLEPNPVEAEVVRMIFDMYARGIGTVRICDELDKEQIKPMKGDKWSPMSISCILNNIHYIGKVRWNRVQRQHKVEDGEIKRYRMTAEDYLIFDGRHDAIVDQELWDAVHAIKGSLPRNKKSGELKNPLAGIIFCTCGRAMVYRRPPQKGRPGFPRLICGDQRCKQNSSSLLVDIVEDVIKTLQDGVDDFEERIKQGTDNTAELHAQMVARLEKKLKELRDLELRQWDEKTKGGMPDHIFERLNSQTVADIREVTEALCEAQNSAPEHVDLREKLVTFRSAIEALKDEHASIKEQNRLVKSCIERIEYSRTKNQLRFGKAGNPNPLSLQFTLKV